MIVVDVNALAYLWIPGEMTALAESALARDPHWVAPVLWRSEFRSILAGYLRGGRMDAAVASRCLDGVETQMDGHEFFVPSALVMRKVAASTCSAYDCEYVALADDLGVPLVTADKQVLAQFPRRATSMVEFARG
jgi:predicted nucleic acid-binding protein